MRNTNKNRSAAILKNVFNPCVIALLLLLLGSAIKTYASIDNPSSSTLAIAEMMPNPDGTDTKTNEYFTLKNLTGIAQNIEGYKICNINNDCYVLKGLIQPQGCLKIFRTDFVFTLHNDKEELILYDPAGNFVAIASTGSALSGKAWLCGENAYCEWGEARDTCDYSDITDPTATEEESQETEENLETTEIGQENVEQENINSNDQTIPTENDLNINTNTNSDAKKSNTIFKIASEKDWVKVKKELNRKNLLSLPIDIHGKLVVPYNIAKINAFHILASNKLVQVNIYASRQKDFQSNPELYQEGTQIEIGNGILKNGQGAWQVGIGKDTVLNIKKNNTAQLKPIANVNFKQIQQYEGKTIKITGTIIKKSGQNFYLAQHSKSNQIILVYIPQTIWLKFLDKQNIGLFPIFDRNKLLKTGDYKGKTLETTGVVEISEKSYRILVTRADSLAINNLFSTEILSTDILQEKAELSTKEDKPGQKTATEEVKDKVTTTPPNESDKKPETETVRPKNDALDHSLKVVNSLSNKSLQTILSQKLHWNILAEVIFEKVKEEIASLF